MSAQPATAKAPIAGPRYELVCGERGFPQALTCIPKPPERLYVVGDPEALREGLAVVGARKATPYGRNAAKLLAGHAARCGIVIISGGARGCDTFAHEAALAEGGVTVAFLGGGCDMPYPACNVGLFQRIVDAGGAVVSEHPWAFPAQPYTFRERNRLIAGLARATLIVEAGLPSGTFSTADEALAANKDVLVVPGSIFSPTSRGANQLLSQGAYPIVGEEGMQAALEMLFADVMDLGVEDGDGTSEDGPVQMRITMGNGGLRSRADGGAGAPRGMEAVAPCVSRKQAGRNNAGRSVKTRTASVEHKTARCEGLDAREKEVFLACVANPMSFDEIVASVPGLDARAATKVVARLEMRGLVERFPDGRYGVAVEK